MLELGYLKNREEAVSFFRKSANLGLDFIYLNIIHRSHNWINWSFGRKVCSETTEASTYLLQAAEMLVAIQNIWENRESWLKDMQDIATKAAFAKLNQP